MLRKASHRAGHPFDGAVADQVGQAAYHPSGALVQVGAELGEGAGGVPVKKRTLPVPAWGARLAWSPRGAASKKGGAIVRQRSGASGDWPIAVLVAPLLSRGMT
jgi:hypothetical protein